MINTLILGFTLILTFNYNGHYNNEPIPKSIHTNVSAVSKDTVLADAIKHLKSYEGFRSNVYYDVDGSATIGYGHHILAGESYSSITEETATKILMSDFISRKSYVETTYSVYGNTSIALTLFAFNCGTGNLRKIVNAGLLENPKIILNYCHYTTKNSDGESIVVTSKKLLQRRQYELRLIQKQN